MVCGLVEQQHVRAHEQDFCQFYAHAPSSGELAGGTVEVLSCETQSDERTFHLGLGMTGVHQLVTLLSLCEALHQCHVFLALIVGTLFYLLLKRLHAPLHAHGVGESQACLLHHSACVGDFHHLRQVSDGSVLRHRHQMPAPIVSGNGSHTTPDCRGSGVRTIPYCC